MRYLKSQEGFSLIEIVVALVLGLLLVTAFAGALTVGLQTEGDMDDRMEVTRAIDSVIEELRNKDLSGVESEGLNDKIGDLLPDGLENDHPVKIDDNLYFIKIEWTEGYYSTETLVSTGIGTVGEEEESD